MNQIKIHRFPIEIPETASCKENSAIVAQQLPRSITELYSAKRDAIFANAIYPWKRAHSCLNIRIKRPYSHASKGLEEIRSDRTVFAVLHEQAPRKLEQSVVR